MRLLAGILAVALPGLASATPWVMVGPRAMGMGGAYTAIAEGPSGAYYNPGALGVQVENPSGFLIPVSGNYEFTGNVLEGANDLFELRKACVGGTSTCTTANIQSALRRMNQGDGAGARSDVSGGLWLKFGRLAVFANNFAHIGATPLVDTARTAVANFDNSATPKNESRLLIRGGQFYEFGVGYGHEIMETGLFLGANIKGIVGRMGFTEYQVVQENPDAGSVLRNFDRSTANSFAPGVDVGLLWDARESFPDVWGRPRIGFVGRNVNHPRFDMPTAAKNVANTGISDRKRYYAEQGQARAGVAFSPFRWWNIAADIDLTENLTMVEDYTSRTYSAGMEFNIINDPALNIPLRAGVSKNIAQGSSGTGWFGGLGLNLMHFNIDIAGGLGERYTQVQTIGASERVPHNLWLAGQLGILFGGTEAISEPRRDPFLPSTPLRTRPSTPSRDPFRR